MSVKDWQKKIDKEKVPPGTEWAKAYGIYAIAYGLLAVAESIEKLSKIIQEK